MMLLRISEFANQLSPSIRINIDNDLAGSIVRDF